MTIKKKNLKPHPRRSAGNGVKEIRGPLRYESEIRIAALSPQSAATENLQASGSDGNVHLSNGVTAGSSAEASTRQKTALMLAGMMMEAQQLGLCRIFRAMTKQGKPCIKVTLELSPDGEWELVGNEIRFVGN